MKLLGVTGGIGMGKSAAGDLLARRGVSVLDTDELARKETAPGSPALEAIVSTFGSAMVVADGSLDRSRLAALVFDDASARSKLESILHPRIERTWRAQVEVWRGEGCSLAAVLIPLLFERGYEASFDAVVAVACSGETQTQRLRQRGWDPGQIAARNAAQLSGTEKMIRARFVVWTEGSLEVHGRQWDRILAAL